MGRWHASMGGWSSVDQGLGGAPILISVTDRIRVVHARRSSDSDRKRDGPRLLNADLIGGADHGRNVRRIAPLR